MGEKFPADGAEDYDIAARLKDMDEEGVDVEVMVPGTFTGHEDPEVDMEFIRGRAPLHRRIDAGRPRPAEVADHRLGEGGRRVGWRDQDVGGLVVGARGVHQPAVGLPARPPGPEPDLGGGGRGRDLLRGAPLELRRLPGLPRPVGQPVHGTHRRAPVGRAAGRRFVLRLRHHGPLPQRPLCRSRVGVRLAPVLGQADGRPGHLHGVRGEGPPTHHERVHDERPVLLLHRPARGPGDGAARFRDPRRRHPDVRVGLPARRVPVSPCP